MLQVKDAERRFDLSSLRLCVSSGEALPGALFHAWQGRFGLELLDVVGPPRRSTTSSPTGPAARGLAQRGADPRVRGATCRRRGPARAPGAWASCRQGRLDVAGLLEPPRADQATMLGEWLRTGDMFYQDADGYFYFCGRADDMLKVGGVWVAPAEVEAALMEHPAVLEAAVIGRADGDGLTRPHAFCVLRDGVHGEGARTRSARRPSSAWPGTRRRAGSSSWPTCPGPRRARSSAFACASDPRADHPSCWRQRYRPPPHLRASAHDDVFSYNWAGRKRTTRTRSAS